ncbi:MAG: SpaA isopeptide-forming pilin-related protein [Defluviitaleaceae bacterium]|nr:SpaA isopeptide-forming pilin-related protein [Defluviitaleaceae bacterium]
MHGVKEGKSWRLLQKAYLFLSHLPGPESLGHMDGWVIQGRLTEAGNQGRIVTSLQHGWENNAFLFNAMYDAYTTRVAVAYSSGSILGVLSGDQSIIDYAMSMVNGTMFLEPRAFALVNGFLNPWTEGVLEGGFYVSHIDLSLTGVGPQNPVIFNQGTLPAGSEVRTAAGAVVPFGEPQTSNHTFRLAVPESAATPGAEYEVEIVGTLNEYAGGWFIRRDGVTTFDPPPGPGGSQRLVFYIPEVAANARIEIPPPPPPENGNGGNGGNGGGGNGGNGGNGTPEPEPITSEPVVIQKIDALTRENIPGAMMRLIGMSAGYVTLPNGESVSFNNTGIQLMQVLTAGATTAASEGVISTVEDGVWTIEGLPFGFYMVYEYRAPDGYSILPAHTARGFWLAPPNVNIVASSPNNENGDGEEEYENGDEDEDEDEDENGDDEDDDDDESSDGDGSCITVNVNVNGVTVEVIVCPDNGGSVDITIDGDLGGGSGSTPTEWEIIETPVESSILITFENFPFSEIIVYKHDDVTGEPLDGAHIRIEGFFVEGNAPVITDRIYVTGQDGPGRVVFRNLPAGTYTITEVFAPPGFMLDDPAHRSVNVSWGQTEEGTYREAPIVRFYNTPYSSVLIEKRDYHTGELIPDGAFFVLSDPTTGRTWEGYSSGGTVRLGQADGINQLRPGHTYIVTEVIPPPGFNLDTPNFRNIVLVPGDDNLVTFFNTRMPYIEIIKIDAVLGTPIPGAWFEIYFMGAGPGTGEGNIGPTGPITGNPFITDANGRIRIPRNYSGIFRIREIRAANGYWLDPLEQNRTWYITVRDNEDYYLTIENTLLPTLVIRKWNAHRNRPVPMTQFRIEFEHPNSPSVELIGYRMTDQQGFIIIPFVGVGWYRITETRPAPGMTLNLNNNYRIFLRPGQNTYQFLDSIRPMVHRVDFPSIFIDDDTVAEVEIDEPIFENPVEEYEEEEEYGTYIPSLPAPDVDIEIDEDDFAGTSPENSNPTNPPHLPDADQTDILISAPENADIRIIVGNPTVHAIVYAGTSYRLQVPQSQLEEFSLEVITQQGYTVAPNWNNGNTTMNLASAVNVTNIAPVVVPVQVEGDNLPPNWIVRPDGSVVMLNPDFDITQPESYENPRYIYPEIDIDNLPQGTAPPNVTVIEQNVEEATRALLIEAGNSPTQVEAAIDAIFNPAMGVPPGGIFGPDWDNDLNVWNWPANAIIVRKFNSVTGELLPNARFDLIDISAGQQQPGGTLGTILGTFWTGHSGSVVITGLYPGTYMVVETQAPNNFTLGEANTRVARLFPDGFSAIALDFYNDPFGSLQITLRDSVTNLPLADGVFRITNAHGQVVGTGNGIFTTNNQGQILIPNLPPAGYVIEQMTPPGIHRLGNIQTQTIFVNASGNIYNVDFLNVPPNTLTVTLRDTEDLQPLAGGIFRVMESGGALVGANNGMFTTNAQGQFTVTIYSDTSYIVEQINPAPGHRLGTQVTQTIMTGQSGQNYVLDFTNEPYRGLIIISLDGYNGDPLPGVRYEVRHQDGTLVGEFTSDNNGRIELTALTGHELLGWFEVVQVYVPNGWEFDAQPQRTIQVTAQNNSQMTFNMPRMGSLEITLTNSVEPFQPLQGASFEVRHQNGQLVGLFVTNNAGGITIPNIGSGWFTITPTQAPTGFTFNDTERNVEVQTNTVARAQFTATPVAALIIELTDPDLLPLAGGVFVVRTVAGTELFRGTTSAGGTIAVPTITDSTVIIEQIQAPPGFAMTTPAQTINIVQGQTNVARFINTAQSNLIIELVNPQGNPLQGGTFELRTIAGTLVHSGVTNTTGTISFANIEAGSFVIHQTAPPTGYVMTELSRPIVFVAGQNLTERFVNHHATTLTIELVDPSGNPLADGEFDVRSAADGSLMHRGTTNAGGVIVLPDLAPGAVIIENTRPAPMHELSDPARTVTLVAGQNTIERFVNIPSATLTIELVDPNGNPLGGGEFEVRTVGGQLVYRGVTSSGGTLSIGTIDSGTFIITQTQPSPGHVVTDPARTITIVAGQTAVERFVNIPGATLTIELVNPNGNPLAGGRFEVRTVSGELIYSGVTSIGGTLPVGNIESGTFIITQTVASPGHVITDPARTVTVIAGQTMIERFINVEEVVLVIEKVDTQGLPLAGATFEVRNADGELLHRGVTNNGGLLTISGLQPGTLVIEETIAPDGFVITEMARTIGVSAGERRTERFLNERRPLWIIQKIDGVTEMPLAGVVFELSTMAGQIIQNPITNGFEFTTNGAGQIEFPFLYPGAYILTELRPLPGYMAIDPVVFTVGTDNTYLITVRNYLYPDFNIQKISSATGLGMPGVTFQIAPLFANGVQGAPLRNLVNGSLYWVTDGNGIIRLPNLEHGTYIATEISAPPGYRIAEPAIFVIDGHSPMTLTLTNYRYSEWNILNVDGDTNQPIAGARFEIAHYWGGGTHADRLRNPNDGTFTFVPGVNGLVNIGVLEPGTYIVTQIEAPQGFNLAPPYIFVVADDSLNTTITIRNYRPAELTIQKVNAVTRAPLEGVIFQISRHDGTRIMNPNTGFFDFVTDRNGLIHLPALEDGNFILTETRALPGFIIDRETIHFSIDASARQREHVMVVENTPASGLLIIVRDANGDGIAGVEVEVRTPNGALVQPQMIDGNQPDTPHNSPQIAANGNFITDASGRINLNNIATGVYHVTVVNAPSGVNFTSEPHVVTVLPGEQAVLEITLAALAGLRLTAVNAITGTGIFNVEFMIFDANNHVVGVFRTDNNGVIDFSHLLQPGRYTIRVTSVPSGFSGDDIPRTVEFVAGRMTEVEWAFMPQAGQIQIEVISADDNFTNALPAGTPLEGAIFEVFDQLTGNLVDRFISNHMGMAVSNPLPLGRYVVRQVQAPAFYSINHAEMDITIEFETQIVRLTYPNFSANIAVTIRQSGPAQQQQGQPIVWNIMQLRNESTVPLADFYWRSTLPTEAVRADRLVTGSFNQSLQYRILGLTSTGREIVVADQLSSTRNNVVELRPAMLGLASDEFLIEFTVHFGQVPAGFAMVENAQIFATILPTSIVRLPANMEFAHLVDVGGRIVGTDEWALNNHPTGTIIPGNQPTGRIPQSGW